MSVTIVTCVRGGTEDIFTCFCAALKRHPIADMDVRLSVLTTGNVSTLTSICRVMEETGLDYEVDIHSVKTGFLSDLRENMVYCLIGTFQVKLRLNT